MNAISMPNRHPVDQLADVRETIKTLQAREAELKDEIGKLMGKADSLGGDEWIARQSLQERKGSIDEARLKAAGIDAEEGQMTSPARLAAGRKNESDQNLKHHQY